MGTVISAAAVIGCCALAVRSMIHDKKKGSGCSGNCAGCNKCRH